MKITILCENQISHAASRTCVAEWGFSAFLQTKNANVLFDTGHSDVYKNNAHGLNIDLNKTDFVILSHYHWDHAKGLLNHDFNERKKLITHPQILEKVPKKDSEKYIEDFEIIKTDKPFEFSPNVYYLGQIPRKNDFEKGMYKDDKMLDDSALAIKSSNGVVVLTGCSHSGICNICEYAKEVTDQKLYAVIGGFHLFEDDPKALDGTMKYFKKENPLYLHPMHCVDFPTLVRLHNEFKFVKYGSGDVIEFED